MFFAPQIARIRRGLRELEPELDLTRPESETGLPANSLEDRWDGEHELERYRRRLWIVLGLGD